MNEKITEKINGVGISFRFITPILILIIGYFINMGIGDVKKKMESVNTHFTNHLAHHQQLEVGYERRITHVEATRFTAEDGDILEEKIKKGIPPQWLLDRILEIEKRLRVN